ncbi:MAG TPA: ABC transporter substrate-binding protein [Verrucomicrobiae bacterium]|jgi:NitT/TauT family transport system substrate-binding protein|nr:ABC transporter substrate-binding protein [Verrucomicrobiae bacterium]
MKIKILGTVALALALASAPAKADEKLDKIRVARASDSATEAALWFAKEGGFFEKHGISAELIRFQGSSLVVTTMLSGEVAISQIGAAAVIDADLAGADLTNIATIIRNFVFYIFARPEIRTMADLKGKAIGTSRFGAISDFAARFALAKNGLEPEKDVAVLQTGGPTESVAALNANRIQAVPLTAPATIRARKLGLKPLLDISKLEANFPFNGIVVRKSFLKNNEDVMRRFMMAYIEGVARAQKDVAFAKKVMAKYFKSDDREVLDESYDWIVKQNFTLPPYPALPGLATILNAVAARNPKAKTLKPEEFADATIVQALDKSGFIANAVK